MLRVLVLCVGLAVIVLTAADAFAGPSDYVASGPYSLPSIASITRSACRTWPATASRNRRKRGSVPSGACRCASLIVSSASTICARFGLCRVILIKWFGSRS